MLQGKILTFDKQTLGGKIRQKNTGKKFVFLLSQCRAFIVLANGVLFGSQRSGRLPQKGDHVKFTVRGGTVTWGFSDEYKVLMTPEIKRHQNAMELERVATGAMCSVFTEEISAGRLIPTDVLMSHGDLAVKVERGSRR